MFKFVPKIVFSDFDGTLTLESELTVDFFSILKILESKKIPLVIVTGRSLSWGHFLLTHFSFLTDVIVEGGGVLVRRNAREIITEENLIPQNEINRLAEFSKLFQNKFPKVPLSADSFGRRTDRAIELYDLIDKQLDQSIQDFMKENQINFSKSSVHLNFWCGNPSKINSINHYLNKYAPLVTLDDAIYFGDSLNDQTAFEAFPHSVGVANIDRVQDRLVHPPKIILKGKENEGSMGVHSYLLMALN